MKKIELIGTTFEETSSRGRDVFQDENGNIFSIHSIVDERFIMDFIICSFDE